MYFYLQLFLSQGLFQATGGVNCHPVVLLSDVSVMMVLSGKWTLCQVFHLQVSLSLGRLGPGWVELGFAFLSAGGGCVEVVADAPCRIHVMDVASGHVACDHHSCRLQQDQGSLWHHYVFRCSFFPLSPKSLLEFRSPGRLCFLRAFVLCLATLSLPSAGVVRCRARNHGSLSCFRILCLMFSHPGLCSESASDGQELHRALHR